MGLLKSLRRALHTKRTLKFRMKGGGSNCDGGGVPGSFSTSSIADTASPARGGGRRRRRTGRRRTRKNY